MGFLEYIIVTPSHHRIHHAINPEYIDKNYSQIFIIWDKLFGTFQAELPGADYQPVKYGLTKNLDDQTPVNLIFHEWKNMCADLRRKDIGLKEKAGYLFGPPGWSHDGSRHTSHQMREIENLQPINQDTAAPAQAETTLAVNHSRNNIQR